MMRGTAVVASRCGGLPEIMQEGKTGLKVPPNDDDALAGALIRVLEKSVLAEQMGAAHAFAKNILSSRTGQTNMCVL